MRCESFRLLTLIIAFGIIHLEAEQAQCAAPGGMYAAPQTPVAYPAPQTPVAYPAPQSPPGAYPPRPPSDYTPPAQPPAQNPNNPMPVQAIKCPKAGPSEAQYTRMPFLEPPLIVKGQWDGDEFSGTMKVHGSFSSGVEKFPSQYSEIRISNQGELKLDETWRCNFGIWQFVEVSGTENITEKDEESADSQGAADPLQAGFGTFDGMSTIIRTAEYTDSRDYNRELEKRGVEFSLSGRRRSNDPTEADEIIDANGKWKVTPSLVSPDRAEGTHTFSVSGTVRLANGRIEPRFTHCDAKIDGPEPRMITTFLLEESMTANGAASLTHEDENAPELRCTESEPYETRKWHYRPTFEARDRNWKLIKKERKTDSASNDPQLTAEWHSVEKHVLTVSSGGKEEFLIDTEQWSERTSLTQSGLPLIKNFSVVYSGPGGTREASRIAGFDSSGKLESLILSIPRTSVSGLELHTAAGVLDFASVTKLKTKSLRLPLRPDDAADLKGALGSSEHMEAVEGGEGEFSLPGHEPVVEVYTDARQLIQEATQPTE